MEHVNSAGSLKLNGVEVLLAMSEEVYCRSVNPATLLVVAHGVVANKLEVIHKGSEGPVLQSPQLLTHSQEGHGLLDDIEVVWSDAFCDRNAKEALGILLFEEADDVLQCLEMLLLSCCDECLLWSSVWNCLASCLALRHAIGLRKLLARSYRQAAGSWL